MVLDVIIPLYKPGQELFALLDSLNAQSLPVQNIILMNTGEAAFKELVKDTGFYEKYPNVFVYHVTKEAFDHGGTRRLGVVLSKADVFVMMTQDVKIVDDKLLYHLTKNLSGDVACSYARQLAGEESGILEQLSRSFNYPDKSLVKSEADLQNLGIKTFFCSNVCAAYRRDIYEKLGGFVKRTIFNEDMTYAAAANRAGYRIAYEADAQVVHAHNYTIAQQFHRNFDLGVSQAEHPEVFGQVKSESEGKKLVASAYSFLKKRGELHKLPYFYLQCAGKYAGYLLGKKYRKLPRKTILACTSNKEYWN